MVNSLKMHENTTKYFSNFSKKWKKSLSVWTHIFSRLFLGEIFWQKISLLEHVEWHAHSIPIPITYHPHAWAGTHRRQFILSLQFNLALQCIGRVEVNIIFAKARCILFVQKSKYYFDNFINVFFALHIIITAWRTRTSYLVCQVKLTIRALIGLHIRTLLLSRPCTQRLGSGTTSYCTFKPSKSSPSPMIFF